MGPLLLRCVATVSWRAILPSFHKDRYQTEAWCDAFAFIQLLHMRQHQNQRSHRQPLDNHIDPDHLNDLNRYILKESFRQARKLQTLLALDYHL